MPERKRWLTALMPVVAAAIVGVSLLPATSGAAPAGTQSVNASTTLQCLGYLDGSSMPLTTTPVSTTVTVTGTLPQSVNPGDQLTLSNARIAFTIPSEITTVFAEVGLTSATGSVSGFPIDVSGSSTATVNAAAGVLPISESSIVAGQPLTIQIPDSGPITIPLGTATGAPTTNATVSVDAGAGFSGLGTATGNGVAATLSGSTPKGGGSLSFACTASAATLGSVAIVAPSATSSTTTPPTTPTTTTSTSTTNSASGTGSSGTSGSHTKTAVLTPGQQLTRALAACAKLKGKKRSACDGLAYKRYRAQELAVALKDCAKQRNAKKRAACVTAAHRKF
jgi:hypothetical protein